MIYFVLSSNIVVNAEEVSVKRYTVLVLDTSNEAEFKSDGKIIYTAETAINYVKNASSRFITNISKTSGNNYIAIVSYKNVGTVVSDFSLDYDNLNNKISDLSASFNTRDISSGLSIANSLLSKVEDENAVKNVVLFTTGMTNNGEYNYDGCYDESTVGSRWYRSNNGVKLYAYANVANEKANEIKTTGTNLYTIGLFQKYEGMPEEGRDIADFFRLTALNLATSEEYFYSVDNPDELEFTFGEIAEEIANELKEIKFTYQSGNDFQAKCYYTDEYFAESSYIYNASLSTMSLAFAMSAFGSSEGGQENYANKSKNARQLLQDIGMPLESIETNDCFIKKPTTDSIGIVLGNMPIKIKGENYTLIAIAIRGGGYEQEWASNFTMGATGQHDGFNEARKKVIEYLRTYISEKNISGPVKIWITGYSRGGCNS